MRALKQKISISLDEDVIIKIKELSELDDRTVSQYINIILKEHIEQCEEKSAMKIFLNYNEKE